jgi:pyruvate-formate lyase-activating enzyme
MKVLLATSPHVKHSEILRHESAPSPDVTYFFAPLGLLSLAAALRQHQSCSVALFDINRAIARCHIPLNEEFYSSAASNMLDGGPDLVGFMTECDSYHHVLQIAEQIKTQNPSCYIVLGGPHASAVANETLAVAPYIDAIVRGEGEISFPRLVLNVAGHEYDNIPGVIRRRPNGEIVDGGAAQLIDDLDQLPMPAYDLYVPDPGEELFLEVGRGCPFQCTFCSTAPYWERRHRVKSPARVIAELADLGSRFGQRRVHFTHDLFTTDRRWVRQLCEQFIRENVGARWTCSARTDTVDGDLLRLMAKAGCTAVYFGIESGSPRILQSIKKNVSVGHSLEVLRACRDAGIVANAGLIVGFPNEDERSLSDTMDAFTAALETGAKPVHLFAFCPFADSSIYQSLNGLSCSGHFVDLPLGGHLDHRNREMISGNRTLFASYFRIKNTELPEGVTEGIDEFSPLVEAALLPSLLLAENRGGPVALLRSWLAWISALNRRRGAPAHRQYYGSAASYLEFCEESLAALGPEYDAAVWHARVIRRCVSLAQGRPPTAMATYKSIPTVKLRDSVSLTVPLSAPAIIDLLDVPYDITSMLNWQPPMERPRSIAGQSYLVWYRATEDRRIELAHVDDILFHALLELRRGAQTPAEVIATWSNRQFYPAGWNGDFQAVLDSLAAAMQAGLIHPAGSDLSPAP